MERIFVQTILKVFIVDIETGENYISDIEFTFIELPKFIKQQSALSGIVDQWVYFIKNAENLNVIPDDVQDSGLHTAYEDADRHNWTKDELEAYDNIFIREQDERGRLSLAIRRDRESIATNLLQAGFPMEEVFKYTGLTTKQVQKLIEC